MSSPTYLNIEILCNNFITEIKDKVFTNELLRKTNKRDVASVMDFINNIDKDKSIIDIPKTMVFECMFNLTYHMLQSLGNGIDSSDALYSRYFSADNMNTVKKYLDLFNMSDYDINDADGSETIDLTLFKTDIKTLYTFYEVSSFEVDSEETEVIEFMSYILSYIYCTDYYKNNKVSINTNSYNINFLNEMTDGEIDNVTNHIKKIVDDFEEDKIKLYFNVLKNDSSSELYDVYISMDIYTGGDYLNKCLNKVYKLINIINSDERCKHIKSIRHEEIKDDKFNIQLNYDL